MHLELELCFSDLIFLSYAVKRLIQELRCLPKSSLIAWKQNK